MDDLRPQELIDDYRTPKVPDDTCCGLGETTVAKARTQPATGFVYMVNRFYEPETGRFTQADKLPFDPTQLTNAQNNRWTYCANDPVNLTDPSGLLGFWDSLFISLALIAIGAGIAMLFIPATFAAGLAIILGALSVIFQILAASENDCSVRIQLYGIASLLAALAVVAAVLTIPGITPIVGGTLASAVARIALANTALARALKQLFMEIGWI